MTESNRPVAVPRTVIAHTLYPKPQNPAHGFIRPIGELVDGELRELNVENFCPTMMVFITKNYLQLEEKFPNRQAFKIDLRLSDKLSEFIDPREACNYVSIPDSAEEIKPKDYFQVIPAALPDPNDRTLTLEHLPSTRFIFIDDEENLYGPLKWKQLSTDEAKTIQLDFVDSPLPKVALVPYQIYQISRSTVADLFVSSLPDKEVFIQGLDVLRNPMFLDYASDSELARYCLKLQEVAGKTIIRRKDGDDLVAALSKLQKGNQSVNQKRLQRLPAIIENLINDQQAISDWVGSALSLPMLKDFIGNYIEQNDSRFLEKFKKERQSEIESELQSLDQKIKESQKKLFSVEVEIKEKLSELQKKKTEMIDNFRVEEYSAEMEGKTKEASDKLDQIDKQIEEKKGLVDGLLTVESIAIRVHSLRDRLKDEQKELDKLESNKATLRQEIALTEAELQKKLANLKPYVDAINGSFFPDSDKSINISVKTESPPSFDAAIELKKHVVESIKNLLASRGRVLEFNEVANLLVTTQQSFITVIAGLPGRGKTSLARLLCDVQKNSSRFQEIAVARGWVSQKDLIGYFNPLTNKFQSSSTGLYEFLKALGAESDPNRAMAYVLLDEANLSPLEHYWSVFMGMSDGESGALRLGNEKLTISPALRFMATINYDGTTEPLSPRILDRAPVVVLEKSELSHIQGELPEASNSFPLSAVEMDRLFGRSAHLPELSLREEVALTQIKAVLGDVRPDWGRSIIISPRKQKAICFYCDKARDLLAEDEDDMTTMDYAVLQHVLPQVGGSGKYFANRLRELGQVLSDQMLLQSKAYLDRMIAYGDQDLNSYDFFCW